MSARSERYLAKAQECEQISDAADAAGSKLLYGKLASQWRQLAQQADETDKRESDFVSEINKAEGAIRELAALK